LKYGILGLGKVGINTLSHILRKWNDFPVYWVADSKSILSKESEPFTPTEIRAIIRLKAQSRSPSFCRLNVPNARMNKFRDLRQELRTLNSIMPKKEEWTIFDTTTLASTDDYKLAKAMMGIAGFCTANKTLCADFRLCSALYHQAETCQTFLGLNCTTGVWADQMESVPLVMKHLSEGRVTITKRDNSSLNTFFSLVDSFANPDEAIKEIERAGHLEPGAKDFSKEVYDQVLKARITANICGILAGTRPHYIDETLIGKDRPRSMSPVDIARWHRGGNRNKEFKALVTRIVVDVNHEKVLRSTVSFGKLPKESPLARHFLGKSAIHIETTNLLVKSKDRGGKNSGYFHAGDGGGERTAAKLLWEAKRISRLCRFKGRVPFDPIPVLFAEDMGHESEVRLQERISRSLA